MPDARAGRETESAAKPSLAGVLLDIDGTLLDSNAARAEAWVAALREFDHVVPGARIRPLIGKGGDKLSMEVLGIDDSSAEGRRIADRPREIFVRDLLPNLRPTGREQAAPGVP